MESSAAAHAVEAIHRGRIADVIPQGETALCHLEKAAPVIVTSFLAQYIHRGDEIALPLGGETSRTEIHIIAAPKSGNYREFYQAAVGYVTQPREDKRKVLFVTGQITASGLGFAAVHLPCHAIRDHFYVVNRHHPFDEQPTLYDALRIPGDAKPAELRLAFRIRLLELEKENTGKIADRATERAFNILANETLRTCYDGLLKDQDGPALFPYGGFGSLLVAGDRSRDGQTFFATRILAFRPETQRRRFHAPLRRFLFYDDRAVYRDLRRKLEVNVDQSVMPVIWDQTWNQWKHLLTAKAQVDGIFVRSGKYAMKTGGWHLDEWQSALPSRLVVSLPPTINDDIASAGHIYQRFGQYSQALERVRARIEREPVEKADLERSLAELGLPPDFDVAQITWRPDYDPFYYKQLAKRARHLHLFRDEYIFDLVKAVAVETPQLGHATYLFAKPRSMEQFLALYSTSTKEEIRENRGNIGQKLGFLRRLVHGANPSAWLRDLKLAVGEPMTIAETIDS
jgi:hypothetical protein